MWAGGPSSGCAFAMHRFGGADMRAIWRGVQQRISVRRLHPSEAFVTQKLHFVIGGAQKSGTCTLDRLFRRHGGVEMSHIKETHFFDDESRDWNAPDYRALDAQFPPGSSRMRAEATPVTLYWRPAVRRLHQYNPDIKLIFLLRDPVRRAFSHWQHQWASGREPLPFAEAIRKGRDRVLAQAEIEGLNRYFSYVERGLYGAQLDYVMRWFPARSIHCEIFEELYADRTAGLDRLARFLELDPFPGNLPNLHVNAAASANYPSRLTSDDVVHLSALYRDDVARVESLLGRSIASWHETLA